MRRRDFLAALSTAAIATPPIAAYGRRPESPVIGFLHQASADGSAHIVAAFRDGLRSTGYADGRNVTIEYRWAIGQYDRLPALAGDLVSRKVNLLVAALFPAALAAKAATRTIPIVFVTGSDPVKSHLVASVGRPEANITGVSIFSATLEAKRLELLHELVPTGDLIGVLINPGNPNAETNLKDVEAASHALGHQVFVTPASNELDLESAFVALAAQHVGAVFTMPDTVFIDTRSQIATLGLRHKIPIISGTHEITAAGALASYGASQVDVYRQAAVYAGRILKGEKPGDLPVLQPTKFELVINLKTAKAIGLAVPPTLLARADEVIE